MAINTLAKRNSALAVSTGLLPIPDGTIAQADRQTLLSVYGGILAGLIVSAATFFKVRFVTDIAIDFVKDIVTEIE
jgi:formate/nitrite transporter FocA (FNT family)